MSIAKSVSSWQPGLPAWRLILVFYLFSVSACLPVLCTSVRTVTKGGVAFPGVLVVIHSLDGHGELGRYLSDGDGKLPEIKFDKDLYQIITTCPYGGMCATTVREFFGDQIGTNLTLYVPDEPIRAIDPVSEDHTSQRIASRIALVVTSKEGKALSDVRVVIRDGMACGSDNLRLKGYRTDVNGGIDVHPWNDIWFAVILYQHTVSTYELSTKCPDREFVDLAASQCIEYKNKDLVRVTLP
jgi:hypothetical protein